MLYHSLLDVTERGQKQEKNRASLSNDKENNMNQYDEPKPGCSHWSDDILPGSKNQSQPKQVYTK